MTFLEFIERSFKRVLSVDTEFRLDLTGTVPEKVVCFVYKDIFTGETFRFWEHNLEISPLHFNYDDCLLVSFSAVAEYGCYLKQLHGKPKNMWDCFVENKRLYGPFREKGKFGFILHSKEQSTLLLKKYWKISAKQIKNSVVLERF